ncbi:hypothetical protein QA811_17810 [Streptomyces sp. B21-102]|uniref:DUF6907 domain-containing protein n=1 Tax=Streptomyces sp. B21-102 TaxID=3039416 RepID=UPI002FF18770
MADRILGASLERVTAALPDAIKQAMQAAIPETYTPELAAQFAEAMITELRKSPATSQPITAAERGTEWTLRWGCPDFCIEEHGQPHALESHSTAPIKTSLRVADLDCSGYSDNGENLPWMTAQVVVANDKAQAYGRETRVWLGYGVHLAEVSPGKAREALATLHGFCAELEAVVDQADEIAKDDFEGDPEIAAAHEEAEYRRIKRISEAAA